MTSVPAAAAALSRDAGALIAELARIHPPAADDPAGVRVVRAPGRVNLIGEHTDYNAGLVLPVAIGPGISIALLPTDDRRAVLTRLDTEATIAVDLERTGPPAGTWRDYIAGMAWALREAGAPIRGFRGVLAADLPSGAGLSSSAALELASAWALGGGTAPIRDRLALARAARRAENSYVGVPCGLMDQFAVTLGTRGAALLLDCRTERHEPVPLPDDVAILIAHSGVARELSASGYEQRRRECLSAVEQICAVRPGVSSLRDVDASLLEEARSRMDQVAYRRARHVVSENERVRAVASALRRGSLGELPPLYAAAHASLRDDFEVSTPALDRLVELAVASPGVLGSRLTGAGFGGATVTLVRRDATAEVVDRLRRAYRTPAGDPPDVLQVEAAAGAGLMWPTS